MDLPQSTFENLETFYGDRHGFVFQGAIPCDPEKTSLVSQAVKQKGFVDCDPEFTGQIDERTFVFVYPQGISFDMPGFLSTCKAMEFQTNRLFVVDSLRAVLSYFAKTKQNIENQ